MYPVEDGVANILSVLRVFSVLFWPVIFCGVLAVVWERIEIVVKGLGRGKQKWWLLVKGRGSQTFWRAGWTLWPSLLFQLCPSSYSMWWFSISDLHHFVFLHLHFPFVCLLGLLQTDLKFLLNALELSLVIILKSLLFQVKKKLDFPGNREWNILLYFLFAPCTCRKSQW